MIEDALKYAAAGLPIFPCHTIKAGKCTCHRGATCKSPGKHPLTPDGSRGATTDLGQVHTWWRKWPSANIALATGNGLLAIDVDYRDERNGMLWLKAFRGDLPATAEQVTPTGGRHLLYTYPKELTVANSADAVCRGVDIRGTGGYIMVEPSLHLMGEYMWEVDPRGA